MLSSQNDKCPAHGSTTYYCQPSDFGKLRKGDNIPLGWKGWCMHADSVETCVRPGAAPPPLYVTMSPGLT